MLPLLIKGPSLIILMSLKESYDVSQKAFHYQTAQKSLSLLMSIAMHPFTKRHLPNIFQSKVFPYKMDTDQWVFLHQIDINEMVYCYKTNVIQIEPADI